MRVERMLFEPAVVRHSYPAALPAGKRDPADVGRSKRPSGSSTRPSWPSPSWGWSCVFGGQGQVVAELPTSPAQADVVRDVKPAGRPVSRQVHPVPQAQPSHASVRACRPADTASRRTRTSDITLAFAFASVT